MCLQNLNCRSSNVWKSHDKNTRSKAFSTKQEKTEVVLSTWDQFYIKQSPNSQQQPTYTKLFTSMCWFMYLIIIVLLYLNICVQICMSTSTHCSWTTSVLHYYLFYCIYTTNAFTVKYEIACLCLSEVKFSWSSPANNHSISQTLKQFQTCKK